MAPLFLPLASVSAVLVDGLLHAFVCETPLLHRAAAFLRETPLLHSRESGLDAAGLVSAPSSTSRIYMYVCMCVCIYIYIYIY